jgi:hypothetical protein
VNLTSDPLSTSRDALFTWLCSPDVLAPEGAVKGYTSTKRPTNFLYPEVAALWLTWACWRRARGERAPGREARRRVAQRLLHDLSQGPGLGKDNAVYLFDSALGLHALAKHLDSRGQGPGRQTILDVARLVMARFREVDAVVIPTPGTTLEARWSRRWGPYQLRAAGFLTIAAKLLKDPVLEGDALWAMTQARVSAPLLRAETQARYVHAWAYEGEGLFMAGDVAGTARVADGLAQLQGDEGGLPAWSLTGPDEAPATRLDASAQALRLWLRVDPVRYEAHAERATELLTQNQAADGSLPYEPGSPYRNTWVSLFADQALAWAQKTARDEAIEEEWI